MAEITEEVKTYLKYRRHVVWPSMTSESLRINPADVEGPKSSFEEAEIQNQLVLLYIINSSVIHTVREQNISITLHAIQQ